VTAGKGRISTSISMPSRETLSIVTSDAPSSDADRWERGRRVQRSRRCPRRNQKKSAEGGVKGVKYDGLGQHGYRKKSGADWIKQPAELDDWPVLPDTVGKRARDSLSRPRRWRSRVHRRMHTMARCNGDGSATTRQFQADRLQVVSRVRPRPSSWLPPKNGTPPRRAVMQPR